jgi:hypothetical protein
VEKMSILPDIVLDFACSIFVIPEYLVAPLAGLRMTYETDFIETLLASHGHLLAFIKWSDKMGSGAISGIGKKCRVNDLLSLAVSIV